jgi:hypothetical protein
MKAVVASLATVLVCLLVLMRSLLAQSGEGYTCVGPYEQCPNDPGCTSSPPGTCPVDGFPPYEGYTLGNFDNSYLCVPASDTCTLNTTPTNVCVYTYYTSVENNVCSGPCGSDYLGAYICSP